MVEWICERLLWIGHCFGIEWWNWIFSSVLFSFGSVVVSLVPWSQKPCESTCHMLPYLRLRWTSSFHHGHKAFERWAKSDHKDRHHVSNSADSGTWLLCGNQAPQTQIINYILHFFNPILQCINPLPQDVVFEIQNLESSMYILNELCNLYRSVKVL